MNPIDFTKNYWLKIPLFLYVIGLVVHNVYLSKYGIHEYELVQARYIVSGFGFIGFVVICCSYIAIRVNMSFVGDSFKPDKLLPWLFRVFSLPYVVYYALHGQDLIHTFDGSQTLVAFASLFTSLGVLFFFYSISDLIFMTSDGDGLSARIIRKLIRVWAVPMIVFTLFLATQSEKFASIFWATTYFFFLFIGLAFVQADNKHGVEVNYLDAEAAADHESWFKILFGVIANFYLLWVIVTNYTEHIYPYFPAALGGAKLEEATIHTDSNNFEAEIVLETPLWTIFLDKSDNWRTVKIKNEQISKISYK